jgi:hypothetical protein
MDIANRFNDDPSIVSSQDHAAMGKGRLRNTLNGLHQIDVRQ